MKHILVLSLVLLCTRLWAEATKPNVILILADDLGYSDLGCYGGEIHTPNLDKLAAGGLRFTQFYNSAKCEPTRACLMSGQYWQDCGLGVEQGITMGQAMKSAGYATFAIGKWHLAGNPVERGFDHYFGHLSGGSDYFKGNPSHRLDAQPFKVPSDSSFYTTDANADYAIKFITESLKQQPEKPFFTFLAFNAPHAPLQAWPEDIAKYRAMYRVGWDKVREQRYERQVELGLTEKNWVLSPRPETIPRWDSLTDEEKDFEGARMAVYAAQVDRMDQAIGRVLAKVKELGQEENTLVLFLSDNGASPFDHGKAEERQIESVLKGTSHIGYGLGWANVSETPFRHYKRNMFNGGSCTPCIAHWPAGLKQPGTITEQRAHIIDLMATITDVGGGKWPAQFEGEAVAPLPGKSLRPILSGELREPHDMLYFHLFDHRAIIVGDLKLVSDWGRSWELFNLATDRTELHDLAQLQPEDATRLAKLWTDWAAKKKAPLHSAGGEPIYRHLKDAQEKFVGGSKDTGDKGMTKPGKARKKATTAPAPPPGSVPANINSIRARMDTTLATAEDQIIVTSTGNDPGLTLGNLSDIAATGPYKLVFSVKSKSRGAADLYWTTDARISLLKGQHQSFAVTHDGEWHDVALTLDTKDKLIAIRLDPCSAPGEVRIKGLRLLTSTGETLQSWPAADAD